MATGVRIATQVAVKRRGQLDRDLSLRSQPHQLGCCVKLSELLAVDKAEHARVERDEHRSILRDPIWSAAGGPHATSGHLGPMKVISTSG